MNDKMKCLWQHDLLKGALLLLLGLIILLLTVLIYTRDSRGKETMFPITIAIVLLVCLFWIVGGTLAGRRLLEPDTSLPEKLFLALYVVILVGSLLGVFLTPANSPSHIRFYLVKNMMGGGTALWFGGLYLKRALTAWGKRSTVPPPCEQE